MVLREINKHMNKLFVSSRPSWVDWCAGFRILWPRGRGFEFLCTQLYSWGSDHWRDSVSLARVNPALYGYLEKSGEGKHGRVCESTVLLAPIPTLPGWRANKRRTAPPVGTVKSSAVFFTFNTFLIFLSCKRIRPVKLYCIYWKVMVVFLYFSKEICGNEKDLTMCPLCDQVCPYWKLGDSCLFSKISYTFDNPATVVFAVFMSFWGKIHFHFPIIYSILNMKTIENQLFQKSTVSLKVSASFYF